MFEQERLAAEELPVHPFDACIQYSRQADKYQTVLFEDVRYSVPRSVAFAPVTAALLDRFTHRCHIFEMNGESFRFRESSKQAKEKKTTTK